jgi:hypothetical protein
VAVTEYVMIVVYVPLEHSEAVRLALCEAGAGTVDDGCYDRVTCVSQAVCRYRVLEGAAGRAGLADQEYESQEHRIETICHRDRVEAVIRAVCEVHPYETPAIAVYPTLTGEYKYWRQVSP